jgi:hypothetical protein
LRELGLSADVVNVIPLELPAWLLAGRELHEPAWPGRWWLLDSWLIDSFLRGED